MLVKGGSNSSNFFKMVKYELDVLEEVGEAGFELQNQKLKEGMETAQKVVLKHSGEKAYLAFGSPIVKSLLGEMLSVRSLSENWGGGIGIVVEKINAAPKQSSQPKVRQFCLPSSHRNSKSHNNTNKSYFDNCVFAISFRGCEECQIDLSKLAEKFGGGGHPNAAGCQVSKLANLVEEFIPA